MLEVVADREPPVAESLDDPAAGGFFDFEGERLDEKNPPKNPFDFDSFAVELIVP